LPITQCVCSFLKVMTQENLQYILPDIKKSFKQIIQNSRKNYGNSYIWKKKEVAKHGLPAIQPTTAGFFPASPGILRGFFEKLQVSTVVRHLFRSEMENRDLIFFPFKISMENRGS